MRKRPTNKRISEVELSVPELAKMVLDLQKRVSMLEMHIKGEVALWDHPVHEQEEESAQGRRPLLPRAEVLKRRDQLSYWVEANWGFLSVALRTATEPKHVTLALLRAKKRKPRVMMMRLPVYDNPHEHTGEIWQFLQSGRFRENPRNLAGALAGLPELSWKRSLDISQETPINRPLAREAWHDHLDRNFAKRLGELKKATVPEEVKKILSRSKTNDITYKYLKEHPEEVLEWVVNRENEIRLDSKYRIVSRGNEQ